VLAWSHIGHLESLTIQPVPRAIIGVRPEADHLGGLVGHCMALYPRMNAEESGSRIRKMGRRCRCRPPDPV
jgi:hypothetical protein